MLKIQFSGEFVSYYKSLIKKHPSLIKETTKRINWFRKNQQDTRLRNHLLKRKMKGKFAFSITDDIRIVYEWLGKSTVRFLAIGEHEKVYTSKK